MIEAYPDYQVSFRRTTFLYFWGLSFLSRFDSLLVLLNRPMGRTLRQTLVAKVAASCMGTTA
jgi:hypothetical protein